MSLFTKVVSALLIVAMPIGAVAEEEAEPVVSIPDVLTLEDAQRLAIQNNPSLKAAGARIEQARARTLQAISLYFPQITGGVSGSKTRFSENQLDATRKAVRDGAVTSLQQQIGQVVQLGAIGGGALAQTVGVWSIQTYGALDIDESDETYAANITASWLLFDGFQREFNYRAARIARKESDAAYLEAQRLLLAAVAGAFFQAQLAYENVLIAEADLEFNERLLEEAEARKRVGSGSLSDVINFKVQMNRARASRIDATRALDVARAGLAELIAAPLGVLPDTVELEELHAESPGEMVLPDAQVQVESAFAARPDLRQTALAVDRADALVKARRGSYLPTAALSVSRDAVSFGEFDIDSDDWSTTFGLSVTYTFFNGGRRRAEIHEAKWIRDEIRWSEEALQNQAVREVQTALINLHAAQQSLILQRSNAELVARNRELVEIGYRAGQDSLVRLTQAERDFTSARAQLALALVSLRSAWHDLNTATAATLQRVENW